MERGEQASSYSFLASTQSIQDSLPALVRVVRARRSVALGAAACAILAGLLGALLWPVRFTARAVIVPPQQANSAGSALLSQLGALGIGAGIAGSSMRNPNDMQAALLRSRTVEEAMAKRFDLQHLYRCRHVSTAIKRWERMTSVETGVKDGLLRISVTDTSPVRAAELANGWVDEYEQLVAKLAITEAGGRRLFFSQQVEKARRDLAGAEDDFAHVQERTGVIEVQGQTRALFESAGLLRAKAAAKQVEIQGMRAYAADQNPQLERERDELSSLEAQLAALESGSAEADLVAPRGSEPAAALTYARALREVKYREAMLEFVTRQFEAAEVDEARQGSVPQVVDAAIPPDMPSSPRWWWIVLLGFVLALPVAVLSAIAAEVPNAIRRLPVHAQTTLGCAMEIAS